MSEKIIKQATEVLKQMTEETLKQATNDLKRVREYHTELGKTIEVLEAKIKQLKKDEEYEKDSEEKAFKQYITSQWCTCMRLRTNVAHDGVYQFYHTFCIVPVSYETFKHFFESDECYCGECEK